MIWKWWRARRRRKILAQNFPTEWEAWLPTHCRQFSRLSPAFQQRLRNDVQILVAEKHWEGCNGLVVTPEMQVTIAAQAALMGLGFPAVPFDRLLSILIYPETFIAKRMTRMTDGAWLKSNEPRLGEAWYQGPVILVWREIREQYLEGPTGRNVVIHESAHLLDMEDHDVNGMPAMENGEQYRNWMEVTEAEFDRLQRQVRFGRKTVIDSYGATSRAEFFAVASEAFFEDPLRLREDVPRLYEVLKVYYKQDPAAWWAM